ncbi:MAG: CPBP family intramembrane metalloprotease [Coriobacteriia bacterium]|nr:CPBP family intramembrane metalloprotease [Coriobacteriia bacterium]
MDDNKPVGSYLDWSAEGKASVWRYLFGLTLVIVVFFVLSGFGSLPVRIFVPNYEDSLVMSVVATLMSFVIAFVSIPLVVRLVHKRPFWSVAMPAWRFEGWNFGVGLAVGVVVAGVFSALFSVAGILPVERNPDFDLGTLVLLAVVGFVGIFIQAGSEELLFRGYLTQFARRFTSSKLLFIGIPTLLFAAPHAGNIAQYRGNVFVLAPYLLAGAFYGWAAWRTGSLWMATALHLANNYTSLVLVGTKGDALPSAAPFVIGLPGIGVVTLVVFASYAAQFLVLTYLMKRAGR